MNPLDGGRVPRPATTNQFSDGRYEVQYAAGVGGTRVSFDVDGQGPAMVLVHGTGGDSDSNWKHLVGRLSENRMVIRPNYSGSGETTDGGGPLTIALLAAQVVAAAAECGVATFDVVGFSLGSAVATHLAAEYPDVVRSVVLLSGFVSTADTRQAMQFDLWRHLIHTDRGAMARVMLLSGLSPQFISQMEPAALQQAIDDTVANVDWHGMGRQVELDLSIDVRDQARRIAKPTLVIGCTYDQMVPAYHARELAGLIVGALYAEMPCGHLAQMERPDEFAKLLLDFLQDASA